MSKSSHSSGTQNKKSAEIENFANSEFNPFHDVPNEMFSPFLHYTSIPPPANFQAPAHGDQFHAHLDQDPFTNQFGGVTAAQKISPDNPAYFTNSDDASSTASSSLNRDESRANKLSVEDFFFLASGHPGAAATNKEMVGSQNASNFDEDFFKSIPTKPKKKLNELIMTQSQDNGKMFQSVEFSNEPFSKPKTFAETWDMSNSEYSEGGDPLPNASLKRNALNDFERF